MFEYSIALIRWHNCQGYSVHIDRSANLDKWVKRVEGVLGAQCLFQKSLNFNDEDLWLETLEKEVINELPRLHLQKEQVVGLDLTPKRLLM